MGTKSQTGFTIIEVMLFLAVTGLLAAAILVGSGVAIGQQRYRDSVNSLQTYIQQQYSKTSDVTNDRDKAWTCDSNGIVTEVENASAGEARGTSDCVLMGRLITVDATGTQLVASNVAGYRTPGAEVRPSDLEELATNYRMGVVTANQDEKAVSWGAQIVQPQSVTPMPFSILIVRSPLSGSILTFTRPGVQADPDSMISAINLSTQRDLCVNGDTGSFVGRRLGVRILPYASSQSAIQVPSESDSVCN